jgi:imidazolonepropionase-like amidohydrolase
MSAHLVLRGVTIVDTRDGSLAPDMAIVIENGSITRVAPANSIGADAARVLDGRGAFAVPGYNDAHAHPLNAPDAQDGLAVMLANGITGFRQMSGTPELLEARREGRLMPASDAPELLEMCGEILTGANARSVEMAVAEVRAQHAQGVDFIKVIEVTPEIFFAALAESTRLKLPYLGHLPATVDVRKAAQAGLRSIEHLGPKDSVLLGCSSDETALRAEALNKPAPGPRISGPIPVNVIMRAIASPLLATDPSEFTRYARVIDTFSDERMHDLAAHFAGTGTWHCPTLTRVRTMALADDNAYCSDPNLRYVPLQLRQMWEDIAQQFSQRLPAAARETLARLFAALANLVKPFKAADVKMLAGSDSGGAAAWCIPGPGLHQEFDQLEAAGLSPLDVLQMTTSNVAAFLGRESTMGSISAGKDANLVLLSANPMTSIQNLHKISAVVRAGKHYSATDLAALKTRTEHRIASAVPSSAAVGPPCC